jgi:hypothetical protein
MINNSIPEGQAAVMQLLEDCYEICDQLQTEAESEAAESESTP